MKHSSNSYSKLNQHKQYLTVLLEIYRVFLKNIHSNSLTAKLASVLESRQKSNTASEEQKLMKMKKARPC